MGKLLWLASYPKSGNTWLRAFLHNYILNTQQPHPIDSLGNLTVGETSAHHYARYDPRPASEYSLADVQRMRPLVHADLTRLNPGVVFVKTHNALVKVCDVPLLTPQVTEGAIYILRDPRDVVVSYSHHLGLSIDATIDFMENPDTALRGSDRKVFERLGSWSVHVHFWTRRADPRLLVLRYEDLHQDPENTFANVIRFLGGEPDTERLRRAVQFSNFRTLRGQELATGFVERSPESAAFFRSGRIGEWKNVLTRLQQHRIEAAHGAQMRRFGYLPDKYLDN